jgi:hypothetical protein
MLAPLLGWAVDRLSDHATPAPVWAMWPLALCAVPMLWRVMFLRPPGTHEPADTAAPL